MQLPVLRRFVVSARARGMPEITNDGKLFFREKTIGVRSLSNDLFRHFEEIILLRRFNRPGNTPAQIRAEGRTSGRGPYKPGSDDGVRTLLRLVRRLQSAQTAGAESNVHLT
jgi:hypothetical protein